mmetsp:Transcript_42497/g.98497  ORF Transcript_42497/g.98497 Transcript_42497/m.98497 type:complete len:223 (+) Transcript_42497:274-942(+)
MTTPNRGHQVDDVVVIEDVPPHVVAVARAQAAADGHKDLASGVETPDPRAQRALVRRTVLEGRLSVLVKVVRVRHSLRVLFVPIGIQRAWPGHKELHPVARAHGDAAVGVEEESHDDCHHDIAGVVEVVQEDAVDLKRLLQDPRGAYQGEQEALPHVPFAQHRVAHKLIDAQGVESDEVRMAAVHHVCAPAHATTTRHAPELQHEDLADASPLLHPLHAVLL